MESVMSVKRMELSSLFRQGGVLVILLDIPDLFRATDSFGGTSCSVNNYEFLDYHFVKCLRKGTGNQVTYSNAAEPFVGVLKRSRVLWTAYIAGVPPHPLSDIKFFGHAGAGAAVAGKMPYAEGHLILLPNIESLDEGSFLDACAEYRFKKQGTTPPEWVNTVPVPALAPLEHELASLDKKISELRHARELARQKVEDQSSYRKLLYEKGKTQLEPIVLRALDDLDFGASPSEIIQDTNHEIDGRTSKGSTPGILEANRTR
jgi:hypothetical protein